MDHVLQEQRHEGFPGQRLVVIPPDIVSAAGRRLITRDLCITHIGAYHAAKGHYVSRSKGTAQCILIACISGGGVCQFNGQEWKIRAGDLLFLPPREPHLYHAEPHAPWTIFWIHFRGSRVADHLANLGVSADRPVLTIDDPQVLLDAFEDTIRHASRGYGEAALTGLSTAFTRLLGLAKVHQVTLRTRSRNSDDRLNKTLAMMKGDLRRAWNLRELARHAGLSAPHFTELCRKQTGMPPMSWLIRLRLQRAMDLMQCGTHNVTEAARAVGYDDPFYFSRLFKKHLGVAPSMCRHGP
jgi:AraC family transcriptional regulator, arabinose operon regulatory protein